MATPLPVPQFEFSREEIAALAEGFALLLEWDAEERAHKPAQSHEQPIPECD